MFRYCPGLSDCSASVVEKTSVFKCSSLQSFLEAEDVYIHQLVGLRCCFWEVRKIIRSWFFAILRSGLNDQHGFLDKLPHARGRQNLTHDLLINIKEAMELDLPLICNCFEWSWIEQRFFIMTCFMYLYITYTKRMNKAVSCSKLFCEMRHERRQLPQQIKSYHFKRYSPGSERMTKAKRSKRRLLNLLRWPTCIVDIVDNSTFVY